jgi:large conductance mechanosensitive channel
MISSDLYKNATDRFGNEDSMFQGFIRFITEGNVLNLMVATAMGAAMTKVVDALSKDFLMPVVGGLVDKDFSSDFTVFKAGHKGTKNYPTFEKAVEDKAIAIKYGSIIQSTINFILQALLVYAIIKSYNKARKLALQIL